MVIIMATIKTEKYNSLLAQQKILLAALKTASDEVTTAKAAKHAEVTAETKLAYRTVKDAQLKILAELHEVNTELKALRASGEALIKTTAIKKVVRKVEAKILSMADLKNYLTTHGITFKNRGAFIGVGKGNISFCQGNFFLNKEKVTSITTIF